ncbi:MAG: TetR/AcrR family transcriptional regulator [Acidobacteria bacterium]|nr:TetR/AcrR family transcriptional regulator [Acidobacteriota bacterium]
MALAGKTKKDVLLEFRTTEILEAARTVFAERGFNGATIDAIAVEAGVAKGTVYLYFDSKRELFLASMREGVLALHAEVAAQLRTAGSCEGKLHAFIAARFNYFSRNRAFFRIYYTEFSHLVCGAANAQPEFQDLYEEQAKLLEEVLAEGIAMGQLRPFDAPRTARIFYDLVRAALAQHILHGAGDSPDEPIRTLFEFVWKGIGAK